MTNSRAMQILRLSTFLLAVMLSGCGLIHHRVRAHAHGDVAPDAVAVVKADFNIFDLTMNIESVDGMHINTPGFWDSRKVIEVEVLRGRRVITASFTGDNRYSTTNAVIEFYAEGGKTYLLHAAVIKEDFWTEVGKSIGGGSGTWTAWIVDASTGDTVGGREPPGQ